LGTQFFCSFKELWLAKDNALYLARSVTEIKKSYFALVTGYINPALDEYFFTNFSLQLPYECSFHTLYNYSNPLSHLFHFRLCPLPCLLSPALEYSADIIISNTLPALPHWSNERINVFNKRFFQIFIPALHFFI